MKRYGTKTKADFRNSLEFQRDLAEMLAQENKLLRKVADAARQYFDSNNPDWEDELNIALQELDSVAQQIDVKGEKNEQE